MPRTTHPLDNWFYSKPRIKQAGIEAILIDEPWEQFLAKHHYWTTEDVVRVRCLLRPTQPKIEQFLAKAVFDDEPLSPSLLEAWRRPGEDCFAGCGLQVSTFPRAIFHLAVDGMTGFWGWAASEFTTEWALFSVRGDYRLSESVVPQGFNEYPLGFIKDSHRFKSAALLLSKAVDRGNQLGDRQFWKATSISGDIAMGEVYRMLLGSCGLGTNRVLRMSPEELSKYRPTGAGWDYKTVESIYELDEEHEYCPICKHVNWAMSCDIGMCEHFAAKGGEGEIGDNTGLFEPFQSEWESALEWCQRAADELGESRLRRLVSETCTKLKLPREVTKLLVDDPSGAETAFEQLINFKHSNKEFDLFYNLYLETPDDIKKLTKSLHRMSVLLQRARGPQ